MDIELTTDQKGAIAESAIVHAAIKLGIGVLKPVTDGHRCDASSPAATTRRRA